MDVWACCVAGLGNSCNQWRKNLVIDAAAARAETKDEPEVFDKRQPNGNQSSVESQKEERT
jgi:hypothetical protein